MTRGELMLDTSDKKTGILCILKLLEQYTDTERHLKNEDIEKLLLQDYNVKLTRNAISRHLGLLRDEFHYDIAHDNLGWYLNSRTFEDSELRALVDGVLSSKYIPQTNAKKLIDRLTEMGTPALRTKKLTHVITLPDWIHQRNKDFFLNLELIEEAIRKRLQLSFTYNDVQADGSLNPKFSRNLIVHPFAMICAAGQYYLVCSVGTKNELRHFRIDKITNLTIREEHKAISLGMIKGYTNNVQLSMGRYVNEHNLMFGGASENIVLKMPLKHAGNVLDTFGSKVQMQALNATTMEVKFKASLEGAKIFALQYGSDCEVMEPQALRDQVKAELEKVLRKY